MTTGQRIRAARKEAGLTQVELGEILGVSGSMIAQYETDKRNPKYETLKRIAAALEVPVPELMGLEQIDKVTWGHEAGPEVYRKLEENYQQHHGKQALASKSDTPLQVGETFMDGNLEVINVEDKENDTFTVSFSANPQGVSVNALKELLDYLSKSGISVDGLMELIEAASNIQTVHPRSQDMPELPPPPSEGQDTNAGGNPLEGPQKPEEDG